MNPNLIILLVNNIHFNGGGERVTINMANYFNSIGFKVKIISMSRLFKIPTFPLNKGIEIDYLNINNSKFFSKIKVYRTFKRYLNKIPKETLIFGIGTYANVILGLLNNNSVKTIGCEHNAFNSVSRIWNLLRRYTYKRLSACVVLTSSDILHIKALNSNSYVIPNSISISKYSSNLSQKKFIAIGRLSYQKAFDKMINIFKKFSTEVTDWNLEIYGDGEDKEHLDGLIEKLDLRDRVQLKQFTTDIENVYLNASGILLTSRYEGLPMVLLEAQSYGLPIISYDCKTGPRDVIINQQNGFLIEPNDEISFVNALIQIASNQNLRIQMGKKAKKDAFRFSEDQVYKKWLALINSL